MEGTCKFFYFLLQSRFFKHLVAAKGYWRLDFEIDGCSRIICLMRYLDAHTVSMAGRIGIAGGVWQDMQ